MTATPDNGYRLATLTVTDEDNNDVTVSGTGNTRTFTMPASNVTVDATFEPIPATEPFISIQNKPQDRSVYYGYNEEITLTSTADNITGHTLSYQWYSCDDKNKTNAQKIEGATSSSYTVPTGKSLGDYYHYCVVTATREDNGQTATTDSYVARFSVNKKRVSITGLSVSGKVYDGTTDATVTGTAAISGKVGDDDVTVTAGTAAFTDANAGTDKTVTFSGYSLSGTAADNYRLIAQPESVKADITAKEVSLSWTDTQFTFDGNEHCPTATAGDLISGDTCGVNVTGGQTNAGDSYTATAESLTNGNYKLPADKTIEFSIEKADAAAPAAITKSYLYSKGGSDNITLTGLPEDCGNVVWGAPNTSGSLSWSNFSVTAGVLHYTVSGGTVNTEGIIGVTAETDNYKNITFTVKVKLVDKLPVKPKTDTSVTLKNSTLTYGQTLSALTFNTAVFVSDDAEEKTVAGTLAWKEPAAVPAAGTAGATWVFTPSDENYASCEGTAAITVNKATPTISEAPAAAAITYGQTLGDSALTGGKAVAGNTELNGAFSWKEPSVAPNAADSGSTKYAAVFTPTDSNYESVIVKLTLTVAKKAITPAVTVTGDYTYNGSNIIPTFTVNNGDDELAATDYTVSYSGNVNAGTNTASLTVTAATGGNYTFEAVTATFSIAKATYGDKNVNVSILYGTSKTVDLSGYVCTGGTLGSVTVSDENGIISGTPSVSGKTVTITLADDATKEGKTATVTIPVTSENYNDHRILLTVTLTNCSHTHTELRNYRAATCIVDGYSGDTYCKDCGEKLSTGHTTTDPLGHSEAAPVRENEIAADCTTAGSYDEVVYCTLCHTELSRTPRKADPLGHSEAAPVRENEIAADCTLAGNYDEVVYCTRCHAELSRTARTAEALGHDPGAPIRENFISAACTTAGSYDEVVYCTRCNTEIGRTPITLPSLGHDYVSGKCTRCGAVEVAPGNLQDIIDSAEEKSLTLALDSDTDLSKLKFPKNVKEIAIDGGGHTLGFTGAASLKPNQKLTLSNITIKAEKNGKPQNITITAAAGGLVLENVTLDGKKATVTATKGDLTLGDVTANDLNVKGSANTKLTIDGDVDAATVSGFGTVEVAVALTVTKSLSVNEMKLSDGAVLNVAAGVAVTVKKGISGNGTVHLAEGFKPISISGSITGRIALTSNAPMTDGTLLFKSKLTDLDEHFDVSGIAPEVTDGEYSYGLYSKSGKVYLRAFKMQVGDNTYCEWADIMSGITKSKADAKDYTLTLLGDMDIAAALKLPTKGKYAGLTIDGSGHSISFSGTTLTLTGDLTLKNVKITAMKNGKPVVWTIKMKQYKLVTENAVLENCTVK